MCLAIDLYENLIQMPLLLGELTEMAGSLSPNLASKQSPKPVNPEPNAFVANVYTTFMKYVLNISQRKREADIHHHCELDNFM
jgi:hypothetical protein